MSTNRVLAGPLSDCCFTGFKHEGTFSGSKITIADVPTYLSEPSTGTASEKIFIFLADVYGASWQNNLLLMDTFAQNGFTVLAVDYFLGDGIYRHEEPDFDREKWKEDMHKLAREIMPKWWEAVKEKYGKEPKYCVAGYCFGAPYTMELSADDLVVAAAIAHPAFLNENHFRNIKKPLLLSCAGQHFYLDFPISYISDPERPLTETDHTFPRENRRIAEDILVEHKAQYYFQVFSGVIHGFANRSDPSVPDNRWAKEQSALGITHWFCRFLDERSATK